MAQERESFKDEVSVDVGRIVDFPSLDEASIQKNNPELFTYVSNVEDIFQDIKISAPPLPHLPISISQPPTPFLPIIRRFHPA
jgi:hypothetical protein